eukprot:scaffold1621_cov350-Prasinococcus_capsulatus_cf.AAC.24
MIDRRCVVHCRQSPCLVNPSAPLGGRAVPTWSRNCSHDPAGAVCLSASDRANGGLAGLEYAPPAAACREQAGYGGIMR